MGVDDAEGRGFGPTVVEVWALYGRRVLDARHLDGGAGSKRYTVGESHDVALVVPPAGLPSQPSFALVQGKTLNFTASMRGEVSCGGKTLSLRTLVHDGHATARGSTYSYPLTAGARCRIEHNAVTFFVNVVPPEAPLRLDGQSSRRFWAFNARSLLLFASVLIPAYFATPTADEPDIEIDERIEVETVVAFSNPPVPDEPTLAPDSDGLGGPADGRLPLRGPGDGGDGDGARGGRGGSGGLPALGVGPELGPSRDRSGEGGGDGAGIGQGSGAGRGRGTEARPRRGDGDRRGLTLAGTSGATGTVNPEANRRGRINGSAQCQTLDLLAVEAKFHTHPIAALITPCTPPEPGGIPQLARNFDPDMMSRNIEVLGAMQGGQGHFLASPYGDAFAVGNDSEDVWAGLTNAGPAAATHGRRTGTGLRSRRGDPRVRQAKAKVKGNLDRDIIRRIVRAHLGEVRHCYAGGLARRKKLRGRVAVRFTIGANGKVSASSVSSSSLKDDRVERCICAAVRRWKFPKPQGGGDVVVTYPFVLEPG